MSRKMALLGIAFLILTIVLTLVKMFMLGTLGISSGRMGIPFANTKSTTYDEKYRISESYAIPNSAPSFMGRGSGVGLDTSFLPPPLPPYQPGITPGNDAEDFEITSYTATIKNNGESADICNSILTLKSRKDIIFESSNQSETGCTYTFKVENKNAQEVLAFIKTLDPETLDENTYTVKRAITGYTNTIEILTNKLMSIEETLKQALNAYNEISKIATADKDAESLAKIIDSKVNLIERLTVERINVQNQITEIQRSYNEQLDHLNYTVFTISVYEQKIIDLMAIGDSWIEKLRVFFFELNGTLQSATIGILSFITGLAYYALIFIIILFVAKHGWKMTKEFWKS